MEILKYDKETVNDLIKRSQAFNQKITGRH